MPYALLLDILNIMDDVPTDVATSTLELIARNGDEREFECALESLWDICKKRRLVNVIGRHASPENINVFMSFKRIKDEYKNDIADVIRSDRQDLVIDEDGRITYTM